MLLAAITYHDYTSEMSLTILQRGEDIPPESWKTVGKATQELYDTCKISSHVKGDLKTPDYWGVVSRHIIAEASTS